jgi:hypothetical protein
VCGVIHDIAETHGYLRVAERFREYVYASYIVKVAHQELVIGGNEQRVEAFVVRILGPNISVEFAQSHFKERFQIEPQIGYRENIPHTHGRLRGFAVK